MILHICPRDVWKAATEAGGVYEGDTFGTQGFIHCSTPEKVHIPATMLFRGRTDLLLLVIDKNRLLEPVVWEQGDPPAADGSDFPHLYRPLPIKAVVRVVDYPPNEDGSFSPPTGL